jgi:hypothetical protein
MAPFIRKGTPHMFITKENATPSSKPDVAKQTSY